MKAWMGRILALVLTVVLAVCCVQPVSAVSIWFLEQHPDWHFDLTNEPDRPMTVEEFIALTVSYSYWSFGVEGTTPRDRDGDLPSDWAAPYIREEVQKGVIDPSAIDYQATATLAFAMNFIVNCKGLYGYNAVNLRKFSGASGLTTEQRLCLNVAVDYGYFPYTENLNVSVPLLRRELEEKYLIPEGNPVPVCGVSPKASTFPKSMVFFEDSYGEPEAQIEILKANGDSYNIVSLDAIYLIKNAVSEDKGYTYVGDNIANDNDIGQLEVVDFCHATGKTVLGGVITWYDDSVMQELAGNERAQDVCVEELLQVVEERNLDGLNVDIELDGNAYRQTYSSLVTKLSERLHQRGKLLMLTVGGYMWAKDEATSIYDYSVIKQTADLISLITYDICSARSYNAGGELGAMSNLAYTSRCARYAATYFDPEKVLLGLGGYGILYNTTDHRAKTITMDQVEELLEKYHATPQTHGGEVDDCYFTYTDGGKEYAVYYESDATMKRRIDLARNYGLGGVAGFYVTGNHRGMFEEMEKGLSDLPFRDVAKNVWYYDSVKFAYENNLFNGTSSTTFGPEESMTRAMLVTVLWRYEGKPAPASAANFSDVKENIWYARAVAWASENGIVNGVGRGRFAPDENVTREQMAAILLRYAQKKNLPVDQRADISTFPDHSGVSSWAKEAIGWTVAAQIIGGTSQGGSVFLDPQGNATRAQVAKILRCFIQTYGG